MSGVGRAVVGSHFPFKRKNLTGFGLSVDCFGVHLLIINFNVQVWITISLKFSILNSILKITNKFEKSVEPYTPELWCRTSSVSIFPLFPIFFNSPIFPYIVYKCPVIALPRIKRKKETVIAKLVNFVLFDVTKKANGFPQPSKDQTINYSKCTFYLMPRQFFYQWTVFKKHKSI